MFITALTVQFLFPTTKRTVTILPPHGKNVEAFAIYTFLIKNESIVFLSSTTESSPPPTPMKSCLPE